MFELKPFVVLAALLFPVSVHTLAIGSSRTTTSASFRYTENDLVSCVREFEVKENGNESIVGVVGNNSDDDSFAGSCLDLYKRFRDHYHRDGSLFEASSLSPGYSHFTKSAQLVHQHNKNHPNSSFKLRLNQFADISRSYTKQQNHPSFQQQHQAEEDEEANKKPRNNPIHKQKRSSSDTNSWQIDLEKFREDQTNDATTSDNGVSEKNSNHQRRKLRWNGADVRLLDTHSSIRIEKIHHQTVNPQEQQLTQLQQSRDLNDNQSQQQQQQQQPQSQKYNDINRNLKRKTSNHDSPTLSSVLRIVSSSKDKITKVLMPGDGTNMPPAFSSPQVPSAICGTEVELHRVNGNIDFDKHHAQHQFSKSLDWSTTHNPDGVPLVHRVYDQGNCGSCWAFAATGSLEASAARNTARDHFVTGLTKLQQQIDEDQNNDDDASYLDKLEYYNTKLKDLTDESRTIESETFETLNLSIQELLDCDTSVNEGCVGGSPLLAFPYIHKHGLVSWKEYPYVGYGRTEDDDPEITTLTTTTSLGYRDDTFPNIVVEENETMTREKINPFERLSKMIPEEKTNNRSSSNDNEPTCKTDPTAKNPIATVESWGLLHKNHEALIEYALLYVGPVAVGINGADPSFINYGGGIYDSENCDQTANHALLIVGYGEEEATNRDGDNNETTVRYWIARNSWGESWGEDGFVRVKRGSGEKGVPGVCGIARSPSVALGGIYRSNGPVPWTIRDDDGNVGRYRKNKYITSFDPSVNYYELRTSHPVCDSMFNTKWVHLFNGCVKFSNVYDKNQPLFLVLACLLCVLVAIIPLTVSMLRQHRAAVGNCSIFFEEDEPELSEGQPRSSSFTVSERTHLLTLKDFYADARKQEEETRRPRGKSIVMTSPDHNPFNLVPSATIDSSEDINKIADEEVN